MARAALWLFPKLPLRNKLRSPQNNKGGMTSVMPPFNVLVYWNFFQSMRPRKAFSSA